MAKAFSLDLRQRVLAAYDEGDISVMELTRRFRVKRWWIYKLLRQRRDTGSIAPLPRLPGRKRKLAGYEKRIRQAIQKNPDASLEELRRYLGVQVALSTLWRTLRGMRITLKKSHARH